MKAMAVQNKFYTVEAFEAFQSAPENRERHWELINGEIVEKVVTQEHSIIALAVGTEFNLYLRQHPIGRAGVEGAFHPANDQDNVRLPDVSLVLLDTEKPVTRKGATPYMPDIAVEVQSPDDTRKAMLDKAQFYLANGVRVVILIYTPKRIVEVLTPDDSALLTENDTLTIDLLPDFAVPIKTLFNGV
jgi:Uma2 family endonuclease